MKRKKKTKRKRNEAETNSRANNCKSLASPVYLLALLISNLLCNYCLARAEQEQRHFYVHLPKLGLVGGARPSEEPAAVAFLGIPYAAPPTGPLRFMPPGAASSAPSRPPEQCLLMPDGQRAAVRAHWQFGRQCVHLPDWLPEAAQSAGEAGQLQGEDCLNLNVFVPINESTSASSSMRQQIKSNYPSQQQVAHSSGLRALDSNEKSNNKSASKKARDDHQVNQGES